MDAKRRMQHTRSVCGSRPLQMRCSSLRWQRPVKSSAFKGWAGFCEEQQWRRALLRKAGVRINKVVLSCAFRDWHLACIRSQNCSASSNASQLQDRVEGLTHENERLRRDNERFVRIIDSGEWGRGRVSELVQAGQVLKEERDQLSNLMRHLRQEYEAVEQAKVAQHEELNALKQRMKKKGAANNRMMVKGGSSLNALIRAMKQQVVDTNTGKSDPSLLFDINKLSMNKVQVFPDGELEIKAQNDTRNSPAFVRPSATRSQHRSLRGTYGKQSTPSTQAVASVLEALSPEELDQLKAGLMTM